MATPNPGATHDESWTIPLQIFMWAVIVAGFIMSMVVLLVH